MIPPDAAPWARSDPDNVRSSYNFYGENVIGRETLVDLSALPPSGTCVVALLAEIEGVRGGEVHAVAFIPSGAPNL